MDKPVLDIIKDELESNYNIRFEAVGSDANLGYDLFVFRSIDGFAINRHAFAFHLFDGLLHIIPGTLLRLQGIVNDMELELADPASIERLTELVSNCCATAFSAPHFRRKKL